VRLRRLATVGIAVGTFVACGGRSELFVGPVVAPDAGVQSDGQVRADAPVTGPDAKGVDAPDDAEIDGRDAPVDATLDADDARFDAGMDATLDVTVTPDSGLRCDDGGTPIAYLLNDTSTLYTFDPTTLTARLLGSFMCPDTSGPFTLSVSREGKAYVLYADWQIFEVDLATLRCSSTAFELGQLGLDSELAVAISRASGAEKLLVSGIPSTGTTPILAESDLTTFVLTKVGDILPAPATGTFPIDTQADLLGHLFGLSEDGLMLEMDVSTGAVLSTGEVALNAQSSWAVMAYENLVYAFSDSTVLRYDPATHTSVRLGDVGIEVVGASAVPCAGADGGS